jgi:ADP-heptose:LPS heptosyltransferase
VNVDLMRKIDYYAGVPLTFIATGVVKLMDRLTQPTHTMPNRVLFIELSEMGSAILVDPAMQKLKRDAGVELFFTIFESNKPSLRLLNTIPEENIFTIRESNIFLLAFDTLRFFWWTRNRRIDSVIDLELFSRYTALLTGLSGAANRVGYYGFHNEGLYRGEMLTHRVAYNPHIHIAKNFIALTNALTSDHVETPYSKTLITDDDVVLRKAAIDESARKGMHALVRESYPDYDARKHRIMLINPNASELLVQRRWMPERYVQLAQEVADQYSDILILLTGAPAERDEAEGMRRAIDRDRCINFAGKLKLVELPTLYSIATLMVTNDSGPGHFSSITDMPTFVLFGPETPNLYGSLGNFTAIYAGLACSPCVSAANHRKTACEDNVCLQAISVEQVLKAISKVLSPARV